MTLRVAYVMILYTLISVEIAVNCSIFIILYYNMVRPLGATKSANRLIWVYIAIMGAWSPVATVVLNHNIPNHTLICMHEPDFNQKFFTKIN